jgi:phosphoribosyl 1,2-cyclic phosphodiesterase
MEICFWGTRGSYPVPGRSTLVYGGNTACHSVRIGDKSIIFDAGTGIINLGTALVREKKPVNAMLIISHTHFDHISGLLYFKPCFVKSTQLHIYGPTEVVGDISKVIHNLSKPQSHPIEFDQMGMHFSCNSLTGGDLFSWSASAKAPKKVSASRAGKKDAIMISAMYNRRHPVHGVMNYRVDYMGKSFVYASDIEGDPLQGDSDLARFAAGADVLAHDAQYTEADYAAGRQGWGHSTPAMAVKTAKMAGVKRLALIHFEPSYDDKKLRQMERETKKLFPSSFFAVEGKSIRL